MNPLRNTTRNHARIHVNLRLRPPRTASLGVGPAGRAGASATEDKDGKQCQAFALSEIKASPPTTTKISDLEGVMD